MGLIGTAIKTCFVAVHVTAGAAAGIASGALSTANDAARLLGCAAKGDLEGAGDIVDKRVERMVKGLDQRIQAGAELLEEAGRCIDDPERPFLTQENTKRMTRLATIGLTAAAGAAWADDVDIDDADSGDATSSLDGETAPITLTDGSETLVIENGRFEGDEDDLELLTRAGENPDTEHVDEVVRNISVRDHFLKSHGYDGVPDGWEVHHIKPLSEGGPDTEDNMVLVPEDMHAKITAAHAEYYGWHRS